MSTRTETSQVHEEAAVEQIKRETLNRRIRAARALAERMQVAPDGTTVVNGTPSDCVHIALTGLLERRPDLIVSGINNGQNMGDDTIYSGTVAAAMEGYLFGVPAIAFSLVDKGNAHLDSAAQVAHDLVARYLQRPIAAPFLLNVNIPSGGPEDVRGAHPVSAASP